MINKCAAAELFGGISVVIERFRTAYAMGVFHGTSFTGNIVGGCKLCRSKFLKFKLKKSRTVDILVPKELIVMLRCT